MEDTDVYVYIGDVERSGHYDVTNLIKQRKKNHNLQKNVLFCVATYGGDPSAGYRIGRALQHNYEHITVLVVGPCKSAGTLLAVAAHELIMGDMGELGPLDIQLKKNDEIGELSSGLVIATAIEQLRETAISTFRSYVLDIKYRNQISTKMSADIAAKLTEAIISPMACQIDPIKLGEHQRAMNIALSYGDRLNGFAKNLKDSSLSRLIAGYPAHGFVIDRKEARELFNNVKSPTDYSADLYEILGEMISTGEISVSGSPKIRDFTPNLEQNAATTAEEHNHVSSGSQEGDGSSEQNSERTEQSGSESVERGHEEHTGTEQTSGTLPASESDEKPE
ncbi:MULTISPECIES: SDH family Clp fold serine proteinase [Klebsiella]|uniref:SDH family Clp fold serine proteinase n=1 Tax=Klebsiella TaxID=570 RepID=UPI000D658CCC|nr:MULTISPECIES: SppA protein [Klebsiella]EFU7715898.1 SppA protein [Escherichia coli]NIG79738.1 SppA protein [Klebsiella sp. Ap-873]HBS3080362.1 SppA protein [Klebsiella variicola subsp. variicola]HDH1436255.1 SppA protein [Klebsiella quasipneumoniae subsp. similipneumoniae]EHI1072425.1 SppA protein [Escherichia coli]